MKKRAVAGQEMDDKDDVESRQQNIEFGNSYRLEYIKHLISLSAGIFVLTLTFLKDSLGRNLPEATFRPILIIGWLALITSIISGIYHMRFWAWYFVSWGRGPNEEDERVWRGRISKWRRVAEVIQFYSFFIGLLCLLIFAAKNIYTPPSNKSGESQPLTTQGTTSSSPNAPNSVQSPTPH